MRTVAYDSSRFLLACAGLVLASCGGAEGRGERGVSARVEPGSVTSGDRGAEAARTADAPDADGSLVRLGRICAGSGAPCLTVTTGEPQATEPCGRADLAANVRSALTDASGLAACNAPLDPLPQVSALTFEWTVSASGTVDASTAAMEGEGEGMARGEEGELFPCVDAVAAALRAIAFDPSDADCQLRQRIELARD